MRLPSGSIYNLSIIFLREHSSINRINKINQEVISTWSKILLKIKNSILFLKNESYKSQFVKENILSEFRKFNITDSKIRFESESPRQKYLNSYNLVDINLDTFPCNGGTTSFEASFMGVPTLTMKNNNTYYLRLGESINNNQKMANWIAKDENDYIRKAVQFTKSKKHLSELKKEIRNNVLKSPLFDTENFVNDFYEMLIKMLK